MKKWEFVGGTVAVAKTFLFNGDGENRTVQLCSGSDSRGRIIPCAWKVIDEEVGAGAATITISVEYKDNEAARWVPTGWQDHSREVLFSLKFGVLWLDFTQHLRACRAASTTINQTFATLDAVVQEAKLYSSGWTKGRPPAIGDTMTGPSGTEWMWNGGGWVSIPFGTKGASSPPPSPFPKTPVGCMDCGYDFDLSYRPNFFCPRCKSSKIMAYSHIPAAHLTSEKVSFEKKAEEPPPPRRIIAFVASSAF